MHAKSEDIKIDAIAEICEFDATIFYDRINCTNPLTINPVLFCSE